MEDQAASSDILKREISPRETRGLQRFVQAVGCLLEEEPGAELQTEVFVGARAMVLFLVLVALDVAAGLVKIAFLVKELDAVDQLVAAPHGFPAETHLLDR